MRYATLMSVFLTALIMTATPVSAQTTLKIDGSTGAMPLIVALGKAYEAKDSQPGSETGKGLDSKARIEALNAGKIDLAVASHGLKINELTSKGIIADEIARTPVVFGVNESVSVTNLSEAQICAIYSGALTNWKSVGGPDLAVAARTRPDSEVDAEVARSGIPCLATLKMPETVKIISVAVTWPRNLLQRLVQLV